MYSIWIGNTTYNVKMKGQMSQMISCDFIPTFSFNASFFWLIILVFISTITFGEVYSLYKISFLILILSCHRVKTSQPPSRAITDKCRVYPLSPLCHKVIRPLKSFRWLDNFGSNLRCKLTLYWYIRNIKKGTLLWNRWVKSHKSNAMYIYSLHTKDHVQQVSLRRFVYCWRNLRHKLSLYGYIIISKKGAWLWNSCARLHIMLCISTRHSDHVYQILFRWFENCGRSLRHKLSPTDRFQYRFD